MRRMFLGMKIATLESYILNQSIDLSSKAGSQLSHGSNFRNLGSLLPIGYGTAEYGLAKLGATTF